MSHDTESPDSLLEQLASRVWVLDTPRVLDDLKKQYSKMDKLLDRTLGALRRMGFIDYSEIERFAQFQQLKTWREVAEGTIDESAKGLALLLADLAATRQFDVIDRPGFVQKPDLCQLASQVYWTNEMLESTLEYLELCRFIERLRFDRKVFAIRLSSRFASEPESLNTQRAFAAERDALYRRKEEQIKMLDLMQSYIDTGRCRRQVLAGYFRDPQRPGKVIVKCGFCDNCGIEGERARPVYATRRQADLIERVDGSLAADRSARIHLSLPDLSVLRLLCEDCRPQQDEEPIYDYLHGELTSHVRNRANDSEWAPFLDAVIRRDDGHVDEANATLLELAQRFSDERRWELAETVLQDVLRLLPPTGDSEKRAKALRSLFWVQKQLSRLDNDLLKTGLDYLDLRELDAEMQAEVGRLGVRAGRERDGAERLAFAAEQYAADLDLEKAALCLCDSLASDIGNAQARCVRLAGQLPPQTLWSLSLRCLDVLADGVRESESALMLQVLDGLAEESLDLIAGRDGFADELARLVQHQCRLAQPGYVRLFWEHLSHWKLLPEVWRIVARELEAANRADLSAELLWPAAQDDVPNIEVRLEILRCISESSHVPSGQMLEVYRLWHRLEEGNLDTVERLAALEAKHGDRQSAVNGYRAALGGHLLAGWSDRTVEMWIGAVDALPELAVMHPADIGVEPSSWLPFALRCAAGLLDRGKMAEALDLAGYLNVDGISASPSAVSVDAPSDEEGRTPGLSDQDLLLAGRVFAGLQLSVQLVTTWRLAIRDGRSAVVLAQLWVFVHEQVRGLPAVELALEVVEREGAAPRWQNEFLSPVLAGLEKDDPEALVPLLRWVAVRKKRPGRLWLRIAHYEERLGQIDRSLETYQQSCWQLIREGGQITRIVDICERLRSVHERVLPERAGSILEGILTELGPKYIPTDSRELARWLAIFPAHQYRAIPPEGRLLLIENLAEWTKSKANNLSDSILSEIERLVIDLDQDTEAGCKASVAWFRICRWQGRTTRLAAAVERCRKLQPGFAEIADEVFESLLNLGDEDAIRRLLFTGTADPAPTVRIRQAIQLVAALDRVYARTPSAINGQTTADFDVLRDAFPYRLNNEATMALACVIRIKRKVLSNRWLTPVRIEFDALAYGGHHREAASLMASYPDLRTEHLPVGLLRQIDEYRPAAGGPPLALRHEHDTSEILRLLYGSGTLGRD